MSKCVLWAKMAMRAVVPAVMLLPWIVLQAQDQPTQDQPTQDQDSIKPVPILTGWTAYFTKVNGGTFTDTPSVSPVLLLPIGDKWLVEGRGSYSDSYAQNKTGVFLQKNSYGLAFAEVDYIANAYVTLSAGQYITPFGIYSERLAPTWIRPLQLNPTIYDVTSYTSLGGMLRGGFALNPDKVNMTYAAYLSAADTNHVLAAQRATGGRVSFFFPEHRLEIGTSVQKLLQDDRGVAVGVHGEWQPERLPLTLRSEFVHYTGIFGGGYWFESDYRLSQIAHLKRLELVGREEQFWAAQNLTPQEIAVIGSSLAKNITQDDGGLNYYFSRDVRGSASYGRQFVPGRNANLWVIGITYRFLAPLGPAGGLR